MRWMKHPLRGLTPILVCAGFSLLLWTGTSQALLPDFTKEQLIQQAEGIILGTVQASYAAWTDDHTMIYTYVTLQVQDQFKGQPVGLQMVLQIPGGQVGDISGRVSDAPTFSVGQKVIVHTFMQNTGYNWVYGWVKGVLNVEGEVIPAYQMTIEQFRSLVLTATR